MSMQGSSSQDLWIPVVLCIVVADLNFWYWASTGENDADYAGIAFFFLFALLWFRRFLRGRDNRDAIRGIAAVAALLMMVLRETGTWDRGYVPPYIVFIVFVLLAGQIRRPPAAPVASKVSA